MSRTRSTCAGRKSCCLKFPGAESVLNSLPECNWLVSKGFSIFIAFILFRRQYWHDATVPANEKIVLRLTAEIKGAKAETVWF